MAEEELIASWEYWCYYKRYIRNKITGDSYLSETGKFIPTLTGMVRIGIQISDLSDTEELINYYITALQPNVIRMCRTDFPLSAKVTVYFREYRLNSGKTAIPITVKCWANLSGIDWVTSTPITYEDISEHYIPFDLDEDSYVASTYEKTENMNLSLLTVEIQNLEYTFEKFMLNGSIGFIFDATGGYGEMYGPASSSTYLRPKFTIVQNVSNRMKSNIFLDTEIVSESKIKGVCRDRNRNIITGVQCKITVFDPDTYEVLGTGLSSAADGSFLITTTAKVGNPVVVSFVEDGQSISGTEIMTTRSMGIT